MNTRIFVQGIIFIFYFSCLILGLNCSLWITNRGKRPQCVTLLPHSVNHVPFHSGFVDEHKDNLAAFYLLFRILGTAEAQCEFWLSFTAGLQPP